MNISIKRPILVTGVSLSFLLWITQSLKNSVGEMGDFRLVIITLIAGFWLILKRKKKLKIVNSSQSLSITFTDFQKKITGIKTMLSCLNMEVKESKNQELFTNSYDAFQERLSLINNNIKKNYLDICILSNNKVSPLSLNNILKTHFGDVKFKINIETLNTLENSDINLKLLSFQEDLILFIIHGDITNSEKQTIEKIINNHQKILVLFNDI
ncbi:hypothetical protein, partial [Geminocystis sp. GBBB08]|uniref:hypothetical protein n=1 Tax=Geminocystis sp. GBBB08 TaxID=2604140 RepID=UPI0027E2732B